MQKGFHISLNLRSKWTYGFFFSSCSYILGPMAPDIFAHESVRESVEQMRETRIAEKEKEQKKSHTTKCWTSFWLHTVLFFCGSFVLSAVTYVNRRVFIFTLSWKSTFVFRSALSITFIWCMFSSAWIRFSCGSSKLMYAKRDFNCWIFCC